MEAKQLIDKSYKEELSMLDDVIAKIDRFNNELKTNRKAIESRFGLYRKTEYMCEYMDSFIRDIENIQSQMRENDAQINKVESN